MDLILLAILLVQASLGAGVGTGFAAGIASGVEIGRSSKQKKFRRQLEAAIKAGKISIVDKDRESVSAESLCRYL
jgi:hypothetical protein